MRSFIEKPCALSLAYLCLVLCISSGVQGIWFGRPGDSWMRSKVIWQRPQNEETDQVTEDRGRYPPPRDDVQDALYSWSAEEEDDKRDGVSSKILFNLIRGEYLITLSNHLIETSSYLQIIEPSHRNLQLSSSSITTK